MAPLQAMLAHAAPAEVDVELPMNRLAWDLNSALRGSTPPGASSMYRIILLFSCLLTQLIRLAVLLRKF